MILSNYYRRLLMACMLLPMGYSAWAQNVVFSASASAGKIGVQDQLQVTYTIQDAVNLQTLTPQGLNKDFEVVAGPFQSKSSQISYTNGRTTQMVNVSLTYVLVPKHTGNLTVPSAVAKDAEGHSYQSNSIAVQVVPGTLVQRQQQQQQRDIFDEDPFVAMMQARNRQLQAMRQQQMQQHPAAAQRQQQAAAATAPPTQESLGKDLFIRVAVDKSKVHVGEQVTASYKLYSRIPMNVAISKLPSLNGFWTQDFELAKPNVKPVEEVIDGKKYQVFTLKKSALFPQQTGTLELDPAQADGVARVVQKVQRSNPFADDPLFGSLMMNDPFFNDNFFNTVAYRDVKVNLKSTPVKIEVAALPTEGKPDNYGGAVGKFTVDGKMDKTELTTDDALNYKLTITGSGNLKLIEAPVLKLPNGLESFDPTIVDTVTGRTTTISGSKIITYAISAQTPGDFQVPAIPFTYFDAQAGKYVTLQTQPVTIHVKKGKNYKPAAIAKNTNIALSDIHDISTRPLTNITYNSKPLVYTVGYWSMYSLPVFAFIALAFWRRREDELTSNVVLLKSRRANKVALKRLTAARKLLKENKPRLFYDEVSKAIWLYLSDKLNIPLSALSRETASDALSAKNLPQHLRDDIRILIDECEVALYSPAGGAKLMPNVYEHAIEVISKLEDFFNSNKA
ncbi:MAG: protein BatD [Sphingobacteriales bacterium]|nr:MAG: protein BatD [Sphingobacteriales bacterium]